MAFHVGWENWEIDLMDYRGEKVYRSFKNLHEIYLQISSYGVTGK